jgi:predicted aminopeptidase
LRTSLLVALLLSITGCAVPFYWQAIGGQLELLRHRTPIAKLVRDPSVDAELRSKLERVAEIRRFAAERLGLPDNDSYTSYVALDRSYVVWNVVAAREFSVEPERWCFPFAGCVSYRGFFDRAAAERFESRLREQGLDTSSGGSTAYSTLGYFADPVLSTMITGGEQYIAGLLFHELAHQKLYVKHDSEFSEAFATVIEEFGVERWLEARGAANELDRYRARRQRRAEFGDLIARQQTRLRGVYASGKPVEEMRRDKARAFEALIADYAALKEKWGGLTDYDAWFAQAQNNATLAAVATYTRWVPALRVRLEARGLDALYQEVAELSTLSSAEREARLLAPLSGS